MAVIVEIMFDVPVSDSDVVVFLSDRFALAIKTSLRTCLPRVNLRQITLLRGYIHPNP